MAPRSRIFRGAKVEILKLILGMAVGFLLHMSFLPDQENQTRNQPCNCEEGESASAKDSPAGMALHRPFKPQDKTEVLRYDFFDKHHVYNNINDDPRVKIYGARKEHMTDITKQAAKLLKDRLIHRKRASLSVFHMYYRVDPLRGEETVLHVQAKEKGHHGKKHLKIKYNLELVKPYYPAQLVNLTEITEETTIHFILPLLGAGERFGRFIENFEKVCLISDQKVKLIIVLFEGIPEEAEKYRQEEVELKLKELSFKYRNAQLKVIKMTGDFSRGGGLDAGAKQLNSGDLMYFCDVDVLFDEGFLTRCRENAVQGVQVYYPGVFSQYNPDIIATYSPVEVDLNDIHKYTGHWVHYGFGMVCLYKQDYVAVGGFDLDIQGWGGEDVNLYTKHLKSNLKVFRAMDPTLFHRYHNKSCDPYLSNQQYKMCVGTMTAGYGAKEQLAVKALEELFYSQEQ